MKLLVETTGDFMLSCPYTAQVISSSRPSVVSSTPFIEARMGMRQIKVFSNKLGADATDAEFEKYWLETLGDPDFAIDSFLSAYEIRPEPKAPSAPEPKPKRGSRGE